MRAVNLLPRDEPRKSFKKSNIPVFVGVVSGVLVMTILCAGFLLSSAKVADKRNELDAARAELALVPPPAPQQSSADASLAGAEAARASALQQAINGRVAWDRVLREISLVLPSDVWLSGLTLSSPALLNGTSGGFELNGEAYSHDGVARLLSRLALIPDITNVALDHSNSTVPGKRAPVTFKITADMRTPGATS
jgi:Tfp pilus assembly protein PilN